MTDTSRVRADEDPDGQAPVRIYLMRVPSTSSIWYEDGDDFVPLDRLPLTDGTRSTLEDWSGPLEDWWLDRTGDEVWDEAAAESAAAVEGRQLWRRVRAELADGYEVGLAEFDTGEKRIHWGPARLKLMPDYSSSSLWWYDGSGMVNLDDLPLRDGTKQALEAWSDRMWDWYRADLYGEPQPDPEVDRAEGLRLWRVVSAELGSDYLVGKWEMRDGEPHMNWGPPPGAED